MRIIKSNELKQIELDILTKIDYVCRKTIFVIHYVVEHF